MLWWGAIWGAVLGYFIDRHDAGFGLMVGGVLGWFAARTLRNEVLKDVRRELQKGQEALLQAARAAATQQAPVREQAVEPLPVEPMEQVRPKIEHVGHNL